MAVTWLKHVAEVCNKQTIYRIIFKTLPISGYVRWKSCVSSYPSYCIRKLCIIDWERKEQIVYGLLWTHTHRATIKIKDFQVFYMKEIKYALCGDHMHASVHMWLSISDWTICWSVLRWRASMSFVKIGSVTVVLYSQTSSVCIYVMLLSWEFCENWYREDHKFYGHKWHYIYTCILQLYEIFKILVK